MFLLTLSLPVSGVGGFHYYFMLHHDSFLFRTSLNQTLLTKFCHNIKWIKSILPLVAAALKRLKCVMSDSEAETWAGLCHITSSLQKLCFSLSMCTFKCRAGFLWNSSKTPNTQGFSVCNVTVNVGAILLAASLLPLLCLAPLVWKRFALLIKHSARCSLNLRVIFRWN